MSGKYKAEKNKSNGDFLWPLCPEKFWFFRTVLIGEMSHNWHADCIMYLTVVSWFRISFVMGGSRPGRAIKFLYAPELPEQDDKVPLCFCSSTPISMGPETSLVGSCALNHLCTYDLYSPVHNVLDACIITSITWASGRGLGPGNALVMDMHTSKTLCTGLYKS